MGAWSLSRSDHRGSPYLTSCIWPHLLRHSILSLGGPSAPLPEPSQPVGEPSCGLSTLYLSFILPFLGVSGVRLCCLLLLLTQPLICPQERWVRTMESSLVSDSLWGCPQLVGATRDPLCPLLSPCLRPALLFPHWEGHFSFLYSFFFFIFLLKDNCFTESCYFFAVFTFYY